MCSQCIRLYFLRFRFRRLTPIRVLTDLTDVVDRILPFVESGTLAVVQAPRPLQDFRRNPYGDIYLAVLHCMNCDEEFQLLADVDHGFSIR